MAKIRNISVNGTTNDIETSQPRTINSNTVLTVTLNPNILYVFSSTDPVSIDITLSSPSETDIVSEYHFIFSGGTNTLTSVTWPSGVTFYGGSAPTIELNIVYEVSIMENYCLVLPVNGSGGSVASTLASLTDTNISSPSDGQVLTYDNTSSKWINANIPSELPSLSNNATKILAVNSGATDVEWVSKPSSIDVQINSTSIINNNTADIITETAYNPTSNKIVTKADLSIITFRTWTTT